MGGWGEGEKRGDVSANMRAQMHNCYGSDADQQQGLPGGRASTSASPSTPGCERERAPVRNRVAPTGFSHDDPWPLGEMSSVQRAQNRVRVGGVSLSTTYPRWSETGRARRRSHLFNFGAWHLTGVMDRGDPCSRPGTLAGTDRALKFPVTV